MGKIGKRAKIILISEISMVILGSDDDLNIYQVNRID